MYYLKDELYRLVDSKKLNKLKMVAIDMDGTLLNNDHQLSPRTIGSVKMIADQGIFVLLATARVTSAIKNHIEKLGTSGIVVAHDGALVKDIISGQVYHHETIPKNLVLHILELLEKKKTVVHFNFDEDIYLTAYNFCSEQLSQELGISFKNISSLKSFEFSPTSILLIDVKDALQELLLAVSSQFEGQFEFAIAAWKDNIWGLQFVAKNNSKGKAVLHVAKHFGIKPEEIISFGDNYNDMDMLQETGLGIAMGNAVSELKKVADFVTLSNQEDGVAYVLEALFNSEELA
ncbi:Cof-type HAD-IIB family hydrolase [Scytonema sp. NUACC21]